MNRVFGRIASFIANTAVFDGINDYLKVSANLTGISDGKLLTLSLWIKKTGGDGANRMLLVGEESTSFRVLIVCSTENAVRIRLRDAAAADILNIRSPIDSLTADSLWHHIYICVDMDVPANTKIYLDGTSQTLTTTTFITGGIIDLSMATPAWWIGDSTISGRLTAGLAEMWFDNVYLNSPTSFASGGKPISIGANGQIPTGTAPTIYLSLNGSGATAGAANGWAVDSSSNDNNFAVTGDGLGTTTPP